MRRTHPLTSSLLTSLPSSASTTGLRPETKGYSRAPVSLNPSTILFASSSRFKSASIVTGRFVLTNPLRSDGNLSKRLDGDVPTDIISTLETVRCIKPSIRCEEVKKKQIVIPTSHHPVFDFRKPASGTPPGNSRFREVICRYSPQLHGLVSRVLN
jgi:hypothetical protein